MRLVTRSKLFSILNFIARLTFCLFFLTTSLYCLLAFIPFTYHWVVRGELLAWLPAFVKYHPFFCLASLVLVTPSIKDDMQRGETRRLVLGFFVFHGVAVSYLILRPILPGLENDASSLKWALVSLTPMLWIAAIDFAAHLKQQRWLESKEKLKNSLSIRTAAVPAVFLCLMYAAICYFRFRSVLSFTKTEVVLIAIWTTLSHLLIFVCAFITLNIARRVANRFPYPARTFFILSGLLGGVFGALVMRYIILAGISFDGFLANVYAIAVSMTITLVICGIKLRRPEREPSVFHEIEKVSAFEHNRPRGIIKRVPAYVLWIPAIMLLAYFIPVKVARMDWDFLMQKLSVVLVWTAAFVFWTTIRSRTQTQTQPYSVLVLVLLLIAGLGTYKLVSAAESRIPRLVGNENLNVNATLEAYATYDISFKVAHELLSTISDFSLVRFFRSSNNIVPTANAASGEPDTSPPNEDNGFYGYLKKNTNLMPSVRVDPVDVKLVDELKPSPGEKPNIFIIVVDSLRPDYISPYNDKVSFTPNIANFARESIVMENAFTPYGGTVLAEPAIWTGTMQIHKQYVEPFYPMNSLQKLLDTENYEQFITVDPVLKIILKPNASIVELDKDNQSWQALDLNKSLLELRTKLDQRADRSRPVFAYTQCQNLHVHKLNRERRASAAAYDFPGFESYYSSQVKHLDDGIGEFIKYLKDSGQYDNSIVVVTSDHGDSIGEGGRWGHANWLFPEVLKIPIIIHLPTLLQKKFYWDPKSIAFSSDLTPSLYYMLGHSPINRNEIFGKPLFTLTQKEQTDYQKRSYMVASSYGPTYGILSENGRSLFISDAANSKDYFFNLKNDPMGTRNLVTGEIRSANEKLIRHYMGAINNFYHFDPEQTGSGGK